MSQTINIKDIPGHTVDQVNLMNWLPYLFQFNYHFSTGTDIDFHSRKTDKSSSRFAVAVWHVKQRH